MSDRVAEVIAAAGPLCVTYDVHWDGSGLKIYLSGSVSFEAMERVAHAARSRDVEVSDGVMWVRWDGDGKVVTLGRTASIRDAHAFLDEMVAEGFDAAIAVGIRHNEDGGTAYRPAQFGRANAAEVVFAAHRLVYLEMVETDRGNGTGTEED